MKLWNFVVFRDVDVEQDVVPVIWPGLISPNVPDDDVDDCDDKDDEDVLITEATDDEIKLCLTLAPPQVSLVAVLLESFELLLLSVILFIISLLSLSLISSEAIVFIDKVDDTLDFMVEGVCGDIGVVGEVTMAVTPGLLCKSSKLNLPSWLLNCDFSFILLTVRVLPATELPSKSSVIFAK